MDALKQLQAQHPHVKFLSPSSPGYAESRKIYDTSNKEEPLGIAVPKTAEEVAQLVKFAAENRIDICLRVGGHDPLGRSVASNALLLDLRSLDSVIVDETALTATIGGGVLTGALLKKMCERGLLVAAGSVPWVGYVGWCTMGGYGLFAGNYGLGVDNIVGAKLVNAKGEIVTADEELLKGIRGAGGNFGVIVELTVKAYRLEKILAGTIIFDASNISEAFEQVVANFRILSREEGLSEFLEFQPIIVNTPKGRTFGALFTWSSPDMEAGRSWVDKITALGPVVHAGIHETTASDSCEAAAKVIPPFSFGVGSVSVNIRDMSPQVVGVLGKHLAKMPSDPGTCVSIHQLKGPSAKENSGSVFGAREPHFMVELLASVVDETKAEESAKWVQDMYRELTEAASTDILKCSWVPLTPNDKTDLRKIYGKNYGTVIALKDKFDAGNVFKNALPRVQPSSSPA